MPANGYTGKRKPGKADPYQLWLGWIYREAIRRIVKQHVGLNITEIAGRLPESREELLQGVRSLHNAEANFPMINRSLPPLGKGKARDTARRHLTEMLAEGEVQRVGIRFYPKKPVKSDKLIESLSDIVSREPYIDWSFPTSQGAAIYRTIVYPKDSRHQLRSFFDRQVQRNAETVFYLDEILEHAIGTGKLVEEAYTPTTGSINVQLFKKGWNRYFGNTKLLALLFVFSPQKFLKFLGTPVGRDLAERMLSRHWKSILARGKQELTDNEKLWCHRRRVKALLKKQRNERQSLLKPEIPEGKAS